MGYFIEKIAWWWRRRMTWFALVCGKVHKNTGSGWLGGSYRRESPPKCLKLDDSERGYWRESPQSAWNWMTRRKITREKVHKVPEIGWLWGRLLKRESINPWNLDDPEQTCTITGQSEAPKACQISPIYHNQLQMEDSRFSDLARLPRFYEC